VRFAGHVVGREGVRRSQRKCRRSSDSPRPPTRRGYVIPGAGGPARRIRARPRPSHRALRPLLKKNAVFLWLPEHAEAFDRVKEALTSPMVVKYFDPALPTELLTDASRLKGWDTR
jgi:hypothetical protein